MRPLEPNRPTVELDAVDRLTPAAGGPLSRHRSWLRRLYVTLRTEHTTPAKVALAVGLGVFVGCSPLWGLHLGICFLLATLLRLNRVLVYAAAHVGNPLTAAPILFAEVQVGHYLLHGGWLAVTLHDIEAVGLQGLVASLMVGSLVVGATLGLVIGVVWWILARAGAHHEQYRDIADAIVIRYSDVSIRDAEAAHATLLRDPIYPFLLEEGFHRDGLRLLDLGCGRALAGALSGLYADPPESRQYVGVDSCERYLRAARRVLAEFPGCSVHAVDLRDFDPPSADLVIVNDVLRYLPFGAQDALLRRVARAAPPGARLYLREKNAGAGWRFRLSAVADTIAALTPGRPGRGDQYRRAEDLRNALVAAGFSVRDRTIARSTSPVWVVLEAVRRPAPARG